MLARQALQKVLLPAMTIAFTHSHFVGRPCAQYSKILRQQYELRALTHCFGDERFNRAQVLVDVAAGNRLHRGDTKTRPRSEVSRIGRPARAHRALPSGGFVGTACPAAAAREARSTVGSDQVPPIT